MTEFELLWKSTINKNSVSSNGKLIDTNLKSLKKRSKCKYKFLLVKKLLKYMLTFQTILAFPIVQHATKNKWGLDHDCKRKKEKKKTGHKNIFKIVRKVYQNWKQKLLFMFVHRLSIPPSKKQTLAWKGTWIKVFSCYNMKQQLFTLKNVCIFWSKLRMNSSSVWHAINIYHSTCSH